MKVRHGRVMISLNEWCDGFFPECPSAHDCGSSHEPAASDASPHTPHRI
jgi:hypothetical protein